MFIEMLDLLRCINPHEDTWLVASLRALSNRFVLDGTLGCPVCHAEYQIRKGIADFRQSADTVQQPAVSLPKLEHRDDLATRIGAFLNATEAGGTLVLGGSWGEAAHEVSVLTGSRVLVLNYTRGMEESETVGLLRVSHEIPLAPASALGVAIDETLPPEILPSVVKVVRPGGRIVGSVAVSAPADIPILARDDRYWVAEKPLETVPLRRAGGSQE